MTDSLVGFDWLRQGFEEVKGTTIEAV